MLYFVLRTFRHIRNGLVHRLQVVHIGQPGPCGCAPPQIPLRLLRVAGYVVHHDCHAGLVRLALRALVSGAQCDALRLVRQPIRVRQRADHISHDYHLLAADERRQQRRAQLSVQLHVLGNVIARTYKQQQQQQKQHHMAGRVKCQCIFFFYYYYFK